MFLRLFPVAAAVVALAGPVWSFPICHAHNGVGFSRAASSDRPLSAHDGNDAAFDERRVVPAIDEVGGWMVQYDGATRRAFLGSAALAAAGGSGLAVDPRAASAAADSSGDARGVVSASEVARRLRSVPTFTIVDKRGVPFMVFGEDAKLTAYFFTEYGEAKRILGVASKSSDKARAEAKSEFRRKRKDEGKPPPTAEEEREEIGVNVWREARISTVPLDFAVTLVTRAPRGVYFRVAPSEEDVADALALDKEKDDLPEGKVPLFYFEDFKVPASEMSGFQSAGVSGAGEKMDSPSELSPLYFRKSEAISAWKRGNPKEKDVPDIKVTELFSVITEMVKPGVDDDELRDLVFVPPSESASKEKDCKRAGGREKPFIIGERIVVL